MAQWGGKLITTPYRVITKDDDEHVWDDVAIAGLSLPPSGVAAPEMKLFKGASGTFSDYAVHFDGSNPGATIPDNAAYDFSTNGNMTFECWVKPTNSTFNLLYQAGMVDIYFNSNQLNVGVNGTYRSLGDSIGLNARNHVVVTFSQETTRTRVKFYLNGILGTNLTINNTIANGTGSLYIGSYTSSGYDLIGDIDEILLYDFALSQSQIDERYNSGSGTTSLPTGVDYVTAGANAVGHFECNENTGVTVANQNTTTADSMTINANATWVTGLIGSTAGTFGYFTWHFPPGEDTMLTVNQEILHKFKLMSDASPHVHWSPITDLGTDTVVWEMGFTHSILGGVFPDVTVFQSTNEVMGVTSAFAHLMTVFDDMDMSGNTKVSSIAGGYIARRGTHASDTYAEDAALHYVDSHMKIDQPGSREMYIKY